MKNFFWLVGLCLSFTNVAAQTTLDLLNPLPTWRDGLDIHYISPDSAFLLTKYELWETSDGGHHWQLKTQLNNANDFHFNGNTAFIVGSNGYVLRHSR